MIGDSTIIKVDSVKKFGGFERSVKKLFLFSFKRKSQGNHSYRRSWLKDPTSSIKNMNVHHKKKTKQEHS